MRNFRLEYRMLAHLLLLPPRPPPRPPRPPRPPPPRRRRLQRNSIEILLN